jgi:hypothetical protein
LEYKVGVLKIQTVVAFALTIFIGAFLLFQVQPLIGKYIVPWFGGAPGVWTTCLLFFQFVLLGGYSYAFLCARWLKPRSQIIAHLSLLALALALLPIAPAESWKPDGAGHPTLQILGILGASLGLPCFLLSATSPLMQHWFSYSRPDVSPYRLYALSNAGSLLALVSFPFFFEPRFSRHALASLWGWGLAAYAVSCVFCAIEMCRAATAKVVATKGKGGLDPGPQIQNPESGTRNPAPTVLDHLLWLLLPACASVLLLATTNKMCQEVAVVPFLWILPLSLYLLSFIVCFGRFPFYFRTLFLPALALSWCAWLFFINPTAPINQQVIIYSAGLFICCVVCHGELYRLKPDPRYLTLFYLLIAAGGALGGLFVAVVTPLIFRDYFELQSGMLFSGLLLVLVCVRDCYRRERPRWRGWSAFGASASVAALGFVAWWQIWNAESPYVRKFRNFYGVLTVSKANLSGLGDRFLMLQHGATVHGTQIEDPQRAAWPTLYYGEASGVGLAMRALDIPKRNIGLIGLGVGTLATYGKEGDHFYIYEINPQVLRLAATGFSYLSDCPAKVEISLGDARLSLEKSTARDFDLLVLDAFNSDAIPVHLLTREAFNVYGRHMKTNGIIAVHITNRSLDLEPVVASLAQALNYRVATIDQAAPRGNWWIADSLWMLLSHSQEILGSHPIRLAARPTKATPLKVRLWTDDFASLFQILRPRPPQIDYAFEEAQFQIARSRGLQGDFPGAVETFRLALQKHPDWPELHNNLATLLAICPDIRVRNRLEGVSHAERACELTGYKQPILVSTLAVAYFEAGRVEDAILTMEKASVLASQFGAQELLRRDQALLESYRRRLSHPEINEP